VYAPGERARELEANAPTIPVSPEFGPSPYIRSVFGHRIDLLDPWSTRIDIREIAHALSRICRFGAHLAPGLFYSVAQHSVMVSWLVPERLRLAGLLHDASEAYLGSDIPKPLKDLIPAYREIELPWHRRIQEHFGVVLRPGDLETLKAADNTAYATEKRDLMSPAQYVVGASDRAEIEASGGFECNGYLDHQAAARVFLAQAIALGAEIP
jgi:hypothetical protein